MKAWLINVLIAIDQLAHAIVGGMPDETLSAASFRWEIQGKRVWARRVIDGLFFWDRQHCYKSWRAEAERRHLPDFYRA